MATQEELLSALRNASAAADAGDEAAAEDARRLAQMIQQSRSQTVTSSSEPPAAPEYAAGENELGLPNVDQSMIDEARAAIESGDESAKRLAIARIVGRSSVVDPQSAETILGTAGQSLRNVGETEVRGITQSMFGIGDYVATAGGLVGQALGGRGFRMGDMRVGEVDEGTLGPREMFALQRARRKALNEQNQLAAATSYGVGAVASGGAAMKAASAVPGAGALAPQAGQPILNTVRGAAGGAAAGGVSGALEEGTPEAAATGAVTGGIAGPAAQGLARVGGGVARALGSRITAGEAGIPALAKLLRESPDVLRTRMQDFEAVTGRRPSIVELLDEGTAREVAAVAQSHRVAGEVFNEAEETAARARPGRVRERIQRGGVDTSPTRVEAAQGRRMDRVMRRIGGSAIDLGDEEVRFLMSPDVYGAMTPSMRRRIGRRLGEAIEAAGESGEASTQLTLRDMDDIRRVLRRLANGNSPDAVRFGNMRDEVRRIAGEQVPQYDEALSRFGQAGDYGTGLAEGRKVASVGAQGTREFVDATEAASTAERAGRRAGSRTALAERAGESPAGARTTVDRLADDTGLQERMRSTLRAGETEGLESYGRAEQRAARNLELVAPGNRVRTQAQDFAQTIAEGSRLAAVAGGRASGGFQADIVTRLINRARISPRAAEGLARAIVDPSRTDEVIDALRRAGLNEEEILDVYQGIAVAAGQAAGSATARETAQ